MERTYLHPTQFQPKVGNYQTKSQPSTSQTPRKGQNERINRTRLLVATQMHTDILKYIERCNTCQRANTNCRKASNPLNPNEIPTRPWQIISIDIIGELPDSQGFSAIFVVVDWFSKQIHVIPIHTSLSAEGYTQIFQDHVFKLDRIPEKAICDWGLQFISKFIQAVRDNFQIQGLEYYEAPALSHTKKDDSSITTTTSSWGVEERVGPPHRE